MKPFQANIREKLREGLILSCQGREHTWETLSLSSVVYKGAFHHARQRFIYEIASALELAPDST